MFNNTRALPNIAQAMYIITQAKSDIAQEMYIITQTKSDIAQAKYIITQAKSDIAQAMYIITQAKSDIPRALYIITQAKSDIARTGLGIRGQGLGIRFTVSFLLERSVMKNPCAESEEDQYFFSSEIIVKIYLSNRNNLYIYGG